VLEAEVQRARELGSSFAILPDLPLPTGDSALASSVKESVADEPAPGQPERKSA
jgi:hypothetical protein